MPPAAPSLASLERMIERGFLELGRRVDSVDDKVDVCSQSLEGNEGIRVRLALLEGQVTELRKDVSDQGKAPPAPPARTFRLAPGTGRELLILVVGIGSVLGLWGVKEAVTAVRSVPEPEPAAIPARIEDRTGPLAGTDDLVPTP